MADTACSVGENRAHVAHTAWTVPGAGSTFGSEDGQLKMGYSLPEEMFLIIFRNIKNIYCTCTFQRGLMNT